MTDFGNIPPLSADANEFFALMLEADYAILEILGTLSDDITTVNSKLDSLGASVDRGSNAASLLSSEFYSKQDLDGDGLIYGIDFYISDAPEMLATIPAVGSVITWAQYKILHPELFE